MKYFLFFYVLFFSRLCNGQDTLANLVGDLNKDKIPDKVIIINTDVQSEGDLGTIRKVLIYFKQGNQFKLAATNTTIVMPSLSGVMVGDPFLDAEIKNNTLIINHFGGSNEKWNYIHTYRFQKNNWFLIGAKSAYGSACGKMEEFDYNLNTGQVKYKKSFLDCESGKDDKITKIINKVIKAKPVLMRGYEPGEGSMKVDGIEVYY
jgi:hypothetical protein